MLLADVLEFTQSGIAERYKRLGWSVRQGQKVKDALVEKRLVDERVESTATGKMRVIRLTEKGKLFLESGDASIKTSA